MEAHQENFRFFSCVSADLRRADELAHGPGHVGKVALRRIVSPRFIPVLLCRLAYLFYSWRLKPLAQLLSWLNFFFFGIEIAVQCRIGPGLFLPHTQGTVIGAFSIGTNAVIFQGVTLGARELAFSYDAHTRPIVGDNVTIGAGAKVLGGLHLGSGTCIGANAVVLESLPPRVVAAGVPASIKRQL